MDLLNKLRFGARVAIVPIFLGLVIPAQAVAQEAAGLIVFAIGEASITGADGAARPAVKGENVFSGDTIVTADGRLQIRYSDGGFISLLPKTEYTIDEYKFSGRADGSERGFFRLLKGGMRTITGAVGRVTKENYKVTTPVGTIGIRGTWFSALLDEFGRLLVSVGFDPDDPSGLVIANAGGLLALDPGENAAVQNADTAPVKTQRQVVVDPPPPSPRTQFSVADRRAPSGAQQIFGGGIVVSNLVAATSDNQTSPRTGLGTQIFTEASVVTGSPPLGFFGTEVGVASTNTFATINLDAALTAADPAFVGQIQPLVDAADPSLVDFFRLRPAVNANFHEFDPVLAWGRWTGGRILTVDDESGKFTTTVLDLTGNQSAHFILGQAPSSPLPNFGFATYSFTGGTPSTSESGATIGQGVVSGTLSVNFFSINVASLDMTVNHLATYRLEGNMAMQGAFFSTSFDPDFNVTVNKSFPAQVDGFLAGPGSPPSHAGLTYLIPVSDPVHGVAGFSQTSFFIE